MANYTQLIKTINDNIKANGNQEITGPVLNAVLQAIVKGMSEGALFAGIADTTTNPPAYDGDVFYIAIEPGKYSNFGVDVPKGSIGVLHNMDGNKWDVFPINTYYAIDVDTLMQDSPSSDDIYEAIGGLSNLKRAIIARVPFFGASGDNTVAIAQVEQLSANEVRVVMLNTGTIDGSNELVPIIKKITYSAGQLSLSTEAPTSFIGPLSSLSTNEKGSVVGAINEVNTGLKSAVKPYVVNLTSLLAAQDSESISTAIGGIDNLNGTVQKNQVIFGTLANGTVAVGIRVLGNQTTLTYFVDSVVGLTVNEIIITNTSGTLTKTANTHAVLTENMVVNNLESDETTLPLSAAQGKALSEEVETTYQKITDNTLATTAKTVVGAINEVNQAVKTKQDKLKAGTGVEITSDNIVNVTLDTTVFKVVASLPESPAAGDENKIHLVPAESTEEGNIYTEYVFVNGKWEEFGTYKSEVDLTPYLKKTDAEATYQKINDDTLATTAKTIVGAINENTGNITRIDRAVGNPVIEEHNFTVAESGKFWDTNGQKSSGSSFSLSNIISLKKGDLLSVFLSDSLPNVSLITKVSSDGDFVQSVVPAIGVGGIRTWSYLADNDCYVQISANAGSSNKYTIIKSPFNVAISDNSYMQYLHKVYEEYGAVYNKETGYWELNGLTDLTEEDMFEIYTQCSGLTMGNDYQLIYDSKTRIRTTLKNWTNVGGFFNPIGVKGACVSCYALEVFDVSSNPYIITLNINYMFRNCRKLRTIVPELRVQAIIDSFTETFKGCFALENVKIYGLKKDVDFKDSPLLSFESLQHLVENAQNTAAITVTVHPTTYSYLTGTAQPTEEVGGSSEEWQALVTTAQGKQITFATA